MQMFDKIFLGMPVRFTQLFNSLRNLHHKFAINIISSFFDHVCKKIA